MAARIRKSGDNPPPSPIIVLIFATLASGYFLAPHWVTKIAPLIFLLSLYRNHATDSAHFAASIGLAASAVGDVLLELEEDNKNKNFFIGGIAFFLLAHVCYTRAFTMKTTVMCALTRSAALPVCGAVYVLLLYVLIPGILVDDNDLVAPIVVYGFVISCMVVAAFNRHACADSSSVTLAGLAGAVIFFASDVLIAVNKFRFPFVHAKTFVMLTYYLGQWLIASSLAGDPPAAPSARSANRQTASASRGRGAAKLHHLSLLGICLCLAPTASALSLRPVQAAARAEAKAALLLQPIAGGDAKATDAINAARALETLVALPSAISASLLEQPGDQLGTWQVCFAPHIRALSRLLQTDFDVFYLFRQDQVLLSNVRYSSRLFGSGHLSTSGSYAVQTTEAGEMICKIKWDRIWWDVSDGAPTLEGDRERHVLPAIIQVVGKAAFVEGASAFPLQYLDEDLCVFVFRLLGTKICAKRVA